MLRRSPEESLFTRVIKPIFWTGVVVLVLAIPEFLFLAVWLWLRQGTVNVGGVDQPLSTGNVLIHVAACCYRKTDRKQA